MRMAIRRGHFKGYVWNKKKILGIGEGSKSRGKQHDGKKF